MYTPASIAQLSHAQILKLLRGQGVRIKHGHGHKVHLSTSQHKKLHSAHLKGKGIVLELDPYQCDMHEHMRGEGVMSGLKKAYGHAKKAYGHAKKIAHSVGTFYGEHKETLDPYLNIGKKAAAHKFAHLEEKAKPHLRRHLGKELSSQIGEHVSDTFHHNLHTLGDEYGTIEPSDGMYPEIEPASEIEGTLGMGLRKHRGRPRKRGGALNFKKIGSTIKNLATTGYKKAVSGIRDYAKSPAGQALIQKGIQMGSEAAVSGLGIRRGGALIAAGYGGRIHHRIKRC